MGYGLLAGLFWGLDTVILGYALTLTPFVSTKEAVFLAPFLSTFLHDVFSALWMLIYTAIRKEVPGAFKALKTRSGKFIVLAALLGGPVGMSGYIFSIKYLGAGYTAILSALFPGVGALLSYVFLKDKMKRHQIIGLAVSIAGVIGLGYTPENGEIKNGWLGFLFAFMCVIGWASEAVIIAYGLTDESITDSEALQIRQMTSAVFYGALVVPVIKGWTQTISIVQTSALPVILAAAFFGTVSYLFYYKAIAKIGPSKAMGLNITYCAWAILFGFLLLEETMDFKSIGFALIIVAGSLAAGTEENILKLSKKSVDPF